ncbi:MAG: nitrilase-related carbon-nitrogen hydrolase, partial [Marmoricola sp.]
MDFDSCYAHGFARVAACTIPVAIADPSANAASVLAEVRACHDEGVAVAVFPELCLTGYAIDDLVMQDVVIEAVEAAIAGIVEASADLAPVIVVGAPLLNGNRLYNCAVVVHRGSVLGVVPKGHLPTYREFYEARHFASGAHDVDEQITLLGEEVPFGTDLVFEATDVAGLVL